MRMTEEQAPSDGAAERGHWPVRRREVLDWLVNDTQRERFMDRILVQMSERLVAAGVPVTRVSLHFQTSHPQWRGGRVMWKSGLGEAEIDLYGYEVEKSQAFLKSPLKFSRGALGSGRSPS